MTYHKTPHCNDCRKACPQPFKTVQNHNAMYLSERKATYWHQECWERRVAQDEALRTELDAFAAEMREATRAAQ